MKVRVMHDYYGCETGCCGHVVEIGDGYRQHFEFAHPWNGEDKRVWARQLAEAVIREHWPDCLPTIDWDSIDFDDVSED